MAPAQKLVVDCAAWGARAYFHDATIWTEKADAARAAGDTPLAAHCDAQAEACRVAGHNALHAAGLPDADTIEPETYVDLTVEEIAQRELDAAAAVDHAGRMLRAQRNALLTQSDWTQIPGAPLTAEQQAEWDQYRQELRDLPAQADPVNPVWPAPPKK